MMENIGAFEIIISHKDHPQGDKQQCGVFSIAQKQPQSTW